MPPLNIWGGGGGGGGGGHLPPCAAAPAKVYSVITAFYSLEATLTFFV